MRSMTAERGVVLAGDALGLGGVRAALRIFATALRLTSSVSASGPAG